VIWLRFHARNCQTLRERNGRSVNDTEIEELKEHAAERDFFCVVRAAFRVFAKRSSIVLGTAWAFAFAILIIVVWGATGPKFHYSDTWQLIINTGTTIVTFLMVFVIQNTQNRDAKAIHLKLDELIRALKGARNKLVDLEELSDEELKKLEQEFQHVRKQSQDGDTHRAKIESDRH
jgi:low affinity Fe/Cu permease